MWKLFSKQYFNVNLFFYIFLQFLQCDGQWGTVMDSGELWWDSGALWWTVGNCDGTVGHCDGQWGTVMDSGEVWGSVGHCDGQWGSVMDSGALWWTVGHCDGQWGTVMKPSVTGWGRVLLQAFCQAEPGAASMSSNTVLNMSQKWSLLEVPLHHLKFIRIIFHVSLQFYQNCLILPLFHLEIFLRLSF